MTSEAQLAANLQALRLRLAEVAEQHARDPASIRLVAVTKYIDFEATWQLARLGCKDLGESRPQQLSAKVQAAKERVKAKPDGPMPTWHLIGHLQRNKARRMWTDADWIHSVDSLRLIQTLANLAAEQEPSLRQPRLLLEVNVSGDEAKHGFSPDGLRNALDDIASLPLTFCGLMTMASRDGGTDQARRDFARLRQLRDDLKPQCPDNVQLDELSMGMSGDWEQAVAEGATIIRIGSAISGKQ